MTTLRCDHPDIEEFITAKRDSHVLRHFNLSVLVTDDLMKAVRDDKYWALVFPADAESVLETDTIVRSWPGHTNPVRCRIFRQVRARSLWDKLMRATYDYAEPGAQHSPRLRHRGIQINL